MVSVAGEQLNSFIERIERLEEEKSELMSDIKDIYSELKGTGFDPKIVKQIVKLRKTDKHEREEYEALLTTYMNALGMN